MIIDLSSILAGTSISVGSIITIWKTCSFIFNKLDNYFNKKLEVQNEKMIKLINENMKQIQNDQNNFFNDFQRASQDLKEIEQILRDVQNENNKGHINFIGISDNIKLRFETIQMTFENLSKQISKVFDYVEITKDYIKEIDRNLNKTNKG